jgi:hypothetical protein
VEELQAVYEQEVSFEHWENADPPRFLESTGTTRPIGPTIRVVCAD